VAQGLYVLGGLGSRGFTTAPLLAEHVAALIARTPSPLPLDLQTTVEPLRLKKKPAAPTAS
ncbi:MAG: FAD-dependent cmnm(5)s(2)U34 oxidoreductase, partial [Caulobacteraceae bacterium]|nr:FAD-dependent cmnm(5)s(2)U34 oxidoreductase [Caulobacteraceae bacterium]